MLGVEVALRLRPRSLTVLRLFETCVFGHMTPPVAGEQRKYVCTNVTKHERDHSHVCFSLPASPSTEHSSQVASFFACTVCSGTKTHDGDEEDTFLIQVIFTPLTTL